MTQSREYCEVRSRNQKQQYELACAVTWEKGLDLELVYEEGNPQSYIEQGVMKA